MWLPDRRSVIAVLSITALGACGFKPIYGDGAPAAGFGGVFAVEPGQGRAAYEFRNRLLDRLGGEDGSPSYALAFDLALERTEINLERGGDLARHRLTGIVTFDIRDESDETVHQGSVRSRATYDTTGDTYAARVLAKDAEARLARTLADLVVNRIELTYGMWSG